MPPQWPPALVGVCEYSVDPIAKASWLGVWGERGEGGFSQMAIASSVACALSQFPTVASLTLWLGLANLVLTMGL